MTGEHSAPAWADEHRRAGRPAVLVNLRGRRNLLATEDGRAELVELIRGHEGEVLIVDPFGRAYTGKSQNDAGEVGAVARPASTTVAERGRRAPS